MVVCGLRERPELHSISIDCVSLESVKSSIRIVVVGGLGMGVVGRCKDLSETDTSISVEWTQKKVVRGESRG